MNRILRCDWLAERASWSCNLGQNKWNIWTTPSVNSMMPKWRVFAPSRLHHCFRGMGDNFSSLFCSRLYLAHSELPNVSRKKHFPKSHIINPLLTKLVRSRWLDVGLDLFSHVYMDWDGVEVHKHAKKELGQYPAILTSHLVNNPYIFTSEITCYFHVNTCTLFSFTKFNAKRLNTFFFGLAV